MKQNYYAIKKGKMTGIFETWNECVENTKGFSGAEYKKFSSYEEAQAYLAGIDLNVDLIKKNQEEGYCTIFCDGSYKKDDDFENYSGAYILITANDKESSQNFIGKKQEYLAYRNVSGELLAAIQAIENAISFEQDKIRLYYDYEGIEKWATGEWTANNELSKFYVEHMNELQKIVKLEFNKVAGHTNNSLNEQVDKLAKDALIGHKVHKKMGVNFIYVSNVSLEQYDVLLEIVNDVETIKVSRKLKNKEKIQDEVIDLKGSKVNIIYFNTTKAILIQGDSKKSVFQLILTCINELFDEVKIEKLLNQSYQMKIDMSGIEPVEKILPNLPKDYPNGIIKLLRQSLINLKNHFEAEDYSMYSFPALRALEGHIKYMLNKNEYILTSPTLNCFDTKGMNCQFKYKNDSNLKEKYKWDKIEMCYEVFHNSRHPYFHYGSLIGVSDDTKIMNSFDECEEMIQKVFAIIQESL